MSAHATFWGHMSRLMTIYGISAQGAAETSAPYRPARFLPTILDHPDEEFRDHAAYELSKAEFLCRRDAEGELFIGDKAIVRVAIMTLALLVARDEVEKKIANPPFADPADPFSQKVEELTSLRLKEAAIDRILCVMLNDPRNTQADKCLLSEVV